MVGLYQQEGLDFFDLVERILKKQFNLSVIRSKEFKIPAEAFNPLRCQYEASKIIESLNDSLSKKCDKHLVIVDVDIYTPRFNFIFGLADHSNNVVIVSIHRLSQNGSLEERLGKEIVHEFGHIFRLNHCPIPTCVMYFSHTISDTDRKNIDFCGECRRKIEGI